MEIKQIAIYDSIKCYLEQIPVVTVKKGGYITQRSTKKKGGSNKYYILSGSVKVLNSMGGRKIWIDQVGADWFAGDLSDVYKEYLNCDSMAVEESVLLEFDNEMFEKLLDNVGFAKIFYQKMSQRVYRMYRRMLINSMYSQKEILAFYIASAAKGDRMVCPNMNALCETLGFSRRSLYNALNNLMKDGNLVKCDKYLLIQDKEALMEQGKHVLEYMQ